MPEFEQSYDGRGQYTVALFGNAWELPLVEVQPDVYIASDAGLVLGDTEFIDAAASALADGLATDRIDYLVTPEAKALPLTHSIARQTNLEYVVVRKSVKSYMQDPVSVTVDSITTDEPQHLVLDGRTAEKIHDTTVAIVDDVVSTGGTLASVERILGTVGANVLTKTAIFEEGRTHSDVHTLHTLPIFRPE